MQRNEGSERERERVDIAHMGGLLSCPFFVDGSLTYPVFLFNRVHVHVWCLGVAFTLYTVSTCFQSLFTIHCDSQNAQAFGSTHFHGCGPPRLGANLLFALCPTSHT